MVMVWINLTNWCVNGWPKAIEQGNELAIGTLKNWMQWKEKRNDHSIPHSRTSVTTLTLAARPKHPTTSANATAYGTAVQYAKETNGWHIEQNTVAFVQKSDCPIVQDGGWGQGHRS